MTTWFSFILILLFLKCCYIKNELSQAMFSCKHPQLTLEHTLLRKSEECLFQLILTITKILSRHFNSWNITFNVLILFACFYTVCIVTMITEPCFVAYLMMFSHSWRCSHAFLTSMSFNRARVPMVRWSFAGFWKILSSTPSSYILDYNDKSILKL